jgi:hypothetical protein
MKFELQTRNLIWRSRGARRSELGRKFGPKRFLHKGSKGKPATKKKEGTAVELQSEARCFVEFETPSWTRTWCEAKQQLQEAVGMVGAMSSAPEISSTATSTVREWPFDASRLARSKSFKKGLARGENLELEIVDPTWTARIQASEAFEQTQFGSYLREHLPGSAASITADAKAVVDAVNAGGIPDADLGLPEGVRGQEVAGPHHPRVAEEHPRHVARPPLVARW